MSILITKTPERVQSCLFKALEILIINRLNDGAFTDEEEVRDIRYYFSTLEGLECLLIPFINLPKNHFWEPLKHKYPKLKNIIIDDITFILDFNRGKDRPPKEHGAPYFMESHYRKKLPYWTSECSSFTLSVLANFLELRSKFSVGQSISKRDVEHVIRLNYDWTKLCKRDKRGWAWIYETKEHFWPTWSLLDTFEEILWYQSTKKMFNTLETECEEVVDYIIEKFNESKLGLYFSEWNEKIVKGRPYSVEKVLDLSRLMLAVSLYKQHRAVFPLSILLFKWAAETDFSQIDYKYNLKEKEDYIYDSSLIPSILRTIVTMADKLKPRRIENLDDELGQNHEIVINRVFSKLMESKINHGKHTGLWGIRNGAGFTYELYFTERTIESLTTFLNHYKSTKSITKTEGKIRKRKYVDKKGTRRSEIPNNIDKYTVWIPQLAEQILPEDLNPHMGWKIEDLLEFYLFRLFNITFALDGAEWGRKERAKPVPDGRLIIPDSGGQCLYDAKSSSRPYRITITEKDKFVRYSKEGKRKAAAIKKEVQFFLIIGNSFEGDLCERAAQFQAEANLKMVCICAEDICDFANLVRQKTTNPSELQLIKWSLLLSKGNPLVAPAEYEKTRELWIKDLENL